MNDSDFSEQIITEVQNNPIIWNVEHADHHNKGAVSNAWFAIAKALDKPERICITRWRSLRDEYVRAIISVVKKQVVQRHYFGKETSHI